MNWTRHSTLFLIHLVRDRPILWDESLPDNRDKPKKSKALEDIAKCMGIPAKDAKAKWMSLRGQYLREYRRAVDIWKSGGGDLRPKWFAYKEMEKLLGNYDNALETETSFSKNVETIINLPSDLSPSHEVTPSTSTSPTTPPSNPTMEKKDPNATENRSNISNCMPNLIPKQENATPIPYNMIKQETTDRSDVHPVGLVMEDDDYDEDDGIVIKEERLDDVTPKTVTSDEDISAFGLYVAAQLKKFAPKLQSKAKLEINKLLYDFEIEQIMSLGNDQSLN